MKDFRGKYYSAKMLKLVPVVIWGVQNISKVLRYVLLLI